MSPVLASRRQARRFRPGLDYTLATPGTPWEFKSDADESEGEKFSALQSFDNDDDEGGGGGRVGLETERGGGGHVNGEGQEGCSEGEAEGCGVDEQDEYMVLDAVLCFVDDREPYKEAAWRQDEVGGYVTYLAGDDDDDDADAQDSDKGGQRPGGTGGGDGEGQHGESSNLTAGRTATGQNHAPERSNVGVKGMGNREGQENDAAVYKADEGGMLVSVSAASNALSLVLRDDAGIVSFVKYVSSAAPGSRYDVGGEYLVLGGGDEESDSDGYDRGARGVVRRHSAPLEAVLEEEEEEDEEEEAQEEEAGQRGGGGVEGHSRKKFKAS